ncbi:MAG: type II and III secretion system protein, partial [Verrucomicrobiota bacterium]
IAVPTSTLTSAGGVNNFGAVTSNIEFRDVVLKLEVIPLINSENEVTLKIAQVNDNIIGSQVISGNEIPTLSKQELITTVTLRSGETMVLGGLITERADETVTGLPGIRRIPFLGRALGSTNKTDTREEMLIFIQPHIINGINHHGATSNDLEQHRNQVLPEALKFADPYPPTPLPSHAPLNQAHHPNSCNGCINCEPEKPQSERRGLFRFASAKKPETSKPLFRFKAIQRKKN